MKTFGLICRALPCDRLLPCLLTAVLPPELLLLSLVMLHTDTHTHGVPALQYTRRDVLTPAGTTHTFCTMSTFSGLHQHTPARPAPYGPNTFCQIAPCLPNCPL